MTEQSNFRDVGYRRNQKRVIHPVGSIFLGNARQFYQQALDRLTEAVLVEGDFILVIAKRKPSSGISLSPQVSGFYTIS